jgi:hypothetical protein
VIGATGEPDRCREVAPARARRRTESRALPRRPRSRAASIDGTHAVRCLDRRKTHGFVRCYRPDSLRRRSFGCWLFQRGGAAIIERWSVDATMRAARSQLRQLLGGRPGARALMARRSPSFEARIAAAALEAETALSRAARAGQKLSLPHGAALSGFLGRSATTPVRGLAGNRDRHRALSRARVRRRTGAIGADGRNRRSPVATAVVCWWRYWQWPRSMPFSGDSRAIAHGDVLSREVLAWYERRVV